MKETVVVSDAFTKMVMLSDYFPPIKGTGVDTPVYIYDSGVPGGSMFYLGGTHPYEPATMLSAYVMMENLKVEKGRVFICPHANMSASTVGMLGNAYPKFLHVETAFGPKPYRIGDRNTSPLVTISAAKALLCAIMSSMRSSSVPPQRNLWTITLRVCPMRKARSVAWSSTVGFHQRS